MLLTAMAPSYNEGGKFAEIVNARPVLLSTLLKVYARLHGREGKHFVFAACHRSYSLCRNPLGDRLRKFGGEQNRIEHFQRFMGRPG